MTDIRKLPGLVASVCISRSVTQEFSICLSNMRSYNDRNEIHQVEYKIFDAKLVEEGRDNVCRHALKENYKWLLMVDGDAAPFPRDSLERMLTTAFIENPGISVLGGYCQLSSKPHISTLDTGTGKWEPISPGQGVLPVIRTGGHFLLVKTGILKLFGPPWFRTRMSYPPLKALKEVDNFARIHLDGKNPLSETAHWRALMEEARKGGGRSSGGHIGEDSGFSDRVKAVGGVIAVDTDLVVGHVSKKIILPEDLKKELVEDSKKRFGHVGIRDYH